MQTAHRLISAAALAFLSASTFASTTTYTSSAAFLAQVSWGSYTESFDGLPNPPAGPVPFSGGAFAYSAFAPSDIYLAGGFLGTSLPDESLTITFGGGNITAFGANFYATDLADAFQSVSMTLTLNDGTIEIFTPTSLSDSYRGFTSDVAFASLTISGPGVSLYAGLDNLTVGGAIPEPTSLLLAGLGLAGLLTARRRAA
jgi:PEP-CTERM motif